MFLIEEINTGEAFPSHGPMWVDTFDRARQVLVAWIVEEADRVDLEDSARASGLDDAAQAVGGWRGPASILVGDTEYRIQDSDTM